MPKTVISKGRFRTDSQILWQTFEDERTRKLGKYQTNFSNWIAWPPIPKMTTVYEVPAMLNRQFPGRPGVPIFAE